MTACRFDRQQGGGIVAQVSGPVASRVQGDGRESELDAYTR
jgi:hypothetical protein